ncbi:aspartate dehydrogenase domain-containing protein [Phreatobacter stygius]|uniref:DUF108 domain-containing protein n=1 Tax=Phreatobacter stygius TaxID=1940610 RepID=A0A4D7APF4_9HYPH|nr:aspartate dehydrogenase domain-containing protein [Phreatobacter stygius]QCI63064.1 DUF108 domain-containing protein [Phreatobacter stygius]
MEARRIGVIGAGRIARPVLAYLRTSAQWRLGRCLVREARAAGVPEATADPERFFADPADLIIEAAGPEALRLYGARALALADVWTVSASALAAAELFASLETAGRTHGHRLRLLPGALGGLDGVAAAAIDPEARLHVTASRPGMAGAAGEVFAGRLDDAVLRHANEINIAVAAALAGPGVGNATVRLDDPGPGGAHVLGLSVDSRFGRFSARAEIEPDPAKHMHPVAACIIAALERETATIWAG